MTATGMKALAGKALFAALAFTLLAFATLAPVHASGITTTPFNDPNAGTGSGQGTLGTAISPTGVVVGFYYDSNNVRHGFVTKPPYTSFTEIEVAGSGTGGLRELDELLERRPELQEIICSRGKTFAVTWAALRRSL